MKSYLLYNIVLITYRNLSRRTIGAQNLKTIPASVEEQSPKFSN